MGKLVPAYLLTPVLDLIVRNLAMQASRLMLLGFPWYLFSSWLWIIVQGCSCVYHTFFFFFFKFIFYRIWSLLRVSERKGGYYTCYPPSCHWLDLWSDPRLCMAPLCVLNFLAGTEWPFWWSLGTLFVPYFSLLKVSGVVILYLPSSFLTTDLDLPIGCSATHSLICLQLHLVPFSTIFVPYLSLLRVSEGVGILYLPSSFLTTDLDLLIGCSATHSLICLQLHLVPFSTIFEFA